MKNDLLRTPFKNVPTGEPKTHAVEYRQLLNRFWVSARDASAHMPLLKEFARIVLTFQPKRPYASRRTTKVEGRWFAVCFVCSSTQWLCKHHIIQLQHGGPAASANVVRI